MWLRATHENSWQRLHRRLPQNIHVFQRSGESHPFTGYILHALNFFLWGLLLLVTIWHQQILPPLSLAGLLLLALLVWRATPTGQKTRNEHSLAANELTGEKAISIVCHELKTPLTVINISTQLAQQRLNRLNQKDGEGSTPEDWLNTLGDVQRLLTRIEQQIKIQHRLVNDLLDTSRFQENQVALFMEKLDLTAIVRDTIQDQRQIAPARNIFFLLPEEAATFVMADAERLRQVIGNYLTNAIKFSPPDQPITVILQREKLVARVLVRDEGPGLAKSEQQQIWQRFYQVPGIKASNGTGTGLGLGLHICHTIIECHAGHVGVESVLGKGSTFWFTLPLAQ